MKNSDQILEDERLAIALLQTEAEQFDNFPHEDVQERRTRFVDLDSSRDLQRMNERFHRHFDQDPYNSHFTDIHQNHRPHYHQIVHEPYSFDESRMRNQLNDFHFGSINEAQNIGYVHDDIPNYVLEALFENSENSRPVVRNEESKMGNFNINQRFTNPHREQRRNLRGSSNGARLIRNPGRSRRVFNQRHEIVDEVGNYMIDDEGATYEDLMRLDENNFNKGNGFREDELRRLRVVPFVMKNFKNKESCSICMSEFKSADFIIKLGCEHIYHEKCIKEWLARKKNCAVCKYEVVI